MTFQNYSREITFLVPTSHGSVVITATTTVVVTIKNV